ncbi:folate biosynthesis protein [Sulfolobus sp. A20]|uniref:2-amino-4-hydroxy-6- hydroxymethyldihydropteridine diphosphokinase n=1 Tax=Saccharolobus sp. A20 TaxID=1891280 RepID=UPI000845D5C7|nr:2-amino-4-hydroxy-6-hydroxymethyldihydropteridine diphosphokinase [Sulfolobus sp. A20]TRM73315.1 2-amino-4-hydroxy-6-hydroxymethyldihydropteridine diphosphokinase [Sulfolobus sp. E5]TRM74676.1 2-amino-4-hydroxy-6-hydroxymethyldihydropteridine diphosphokinase [Sulfolobus sp. A20-N-F8]TRM85058.1 2-amino-4-hydroxy-6-hydroxymethyldihydropteridine diphosphokinase [Sulfolobus sp. F3]TRM88102.1 2-amino-4-hydroxy-6-hydroxymethyldihydropteridine diphosphokinase [Sulfolobus sp. E3]TRM98715.1 2-amino-
MIYKVSIEDLRVKTVIGINPNERIEKQEVSINVDIWSDLSKSVITDSINDTIDYKVIKKEIISYVENSSFNLLETLTYKIGKVVLQDHRIRKVRVRVSKPGALSYAKNVSVEVKMRRKDNLAKTYIALGSNISPEENIKKALKLLKERLGALKISTVYLTKPLPPFISQPNFYNCVVETNASLDPYNIKFNILRGIEKELGRVRDPNDKFAPRTIDLDLILYGNLIVNSKDLVIPDPEIEKRPFLALPLYELNEDLVIPGINKSIKEIVKKFSENIDMTPLYDYTEKLRREILEDF